MKTYKKPILISELGVNWNGDFDLLFRMARTALECGADYVKLQTRAPEMCVPKDQWDIPREWFDGTMTTYIDYKKRMELSESQLDTFDNEFHGKWFSSVWDIPSVDKLAKYYLPIIKIPSAKITDLELVEYAAHSTDHLMISTGMSTKQEIVAAIEAATEELAPDTLSVLSCHSAYPSPDNEVDLNRISTLKDLRYLYPYKYKVGFSSHCVSPYPAIYSVFAGAEYVECHFTLDRAMKGTDQAASLEPAGLKLIAREFNRIEQLFGGDGEIKVYDSELPALKKLRG